MAKKRKLLIFLLVLALVIVAGGLFLLNKEDNNFVYKNEFVEAGEFEVIESSEGKFVVCPSEGLRVKVPEGWRTQKDLAFGTAIYLFDHQVGDNFIKSAKEKGACGMAIEIYESQNVNPDVTTFADDLRKEAQYLKENSGAEGEGKSPQSESIVVGGKDGIKRIYSVEGKVTLIDVEIPIGQTVYAFSTGFIGSEKCIEEFNSILKTVEINK